MNRSRDRWVAATTVALLVLLTTVVVVLVLDAQRAAIDSREELRLEQVNQLGNSMDARVQQAYAALGAQAGAPGTWRLVPGDAADSARLRPTDPRATTGNLLLDGDGIVVNGSLLRDPAVIGQPYDHPGLDTLLAGEPVLLPVGPGLTTTGPVIAVGVPVRDAAGTLAGAYLIEVAVAADSAFNVEVAELRAGETGSFSFVDDIGTVVASSDLTSLGQQLDLDQDRLTTGFHRTNDSVVAVSDVPSADWRLVFRQTTDEFEGDLTGPLRTALLILLVAVTVGGAVSVVALLRRLRSARDEQRRLVEIAAARDEFTSIVSHELRTPVAGLLGFLQTTIDHWPDMEDGERHRAVGRAFQNAQRLQHLTNEVLDATSIEAGQVSYAFEPADLRTVVTEVVEVARDTNVGRTFELVTPDHVVPVTIDTVRIRQVVVNLLDNAVKSSAPDDPVYIEVALEGGSGVVTVRDRGAGVALEDRLTIFDKFKRGRGGMLGTTGSGLGLYIARQIVEAHRGRIWVVDADGPGAVMRFVLPAIDVDRVGGE